jgi:hypothetical protein
MYQFLQQLFSTHPECGTFLFLNSFFPVQLNKGRNSSQGRFPNYSVAVKYNLDMFLTQYRVNDIWENGRRYGGNYMK